MAVKWQRLLGKDLRTQEGERLRVIYPGRFNSDNGPDFRDAVISMNGCNLLKGDIEIHIKSSDWYSHGHHRDAEYNRVILHVVCYCDSRSATVAESGKSIPLLCLAEKLWPRTATVPCQQLSCSQITDRLDMQTLGKLLDVAGEERFKRKAAVLQASLRREEAGQVLFQSLMRALGYSKNMEPFEELARRLPLDSLEQTVPRESLLVKQASLLGMAGLLPSQRSGGRFSKEGETAELERIWRLMGKSARTMTEGDWHFSHVYPNNSPVRRIVAQSYLLQRYHEDGLLMGISRMVEVMPSVAASRSLEDGLVVPGNDYWRDRFDFSMGAKTRNSALLGHSKAGEMIVNVVLPLVFSCAGISNKPELKRKAIDIYLNYPKLSENEITRHMLRQLCLESSTGLTACHQQGLIHIFRNYCREGRCNECPLSLG